jgi:hypothetical protein
MKQIKSTILTISLFFVLQIINAQNDTRTYNLQEFNKVQIENINGEVEIELGKAYSIIITGKDNAQEQVQISKLEDKLLIKLDNKFVTDWNKRKVVKVKIIMPAISKLFNFSNADINIQKIAGNYLGIENKGNGNISVAGFTLDFFEIKNNGNGNIETKNIISVKVDITKSGNGDVNVRTDANFNVSMAGNGDIINYGKGKAIINKQSGTGKVVYRN